MDTVGSQITSLTIVYSTVYSGADQRKHQSSASLAFVWGNSPVTGQRAGNAEKVSIWWRHHVAEYATGPWNKMSYWWNRNHLPHQRLTFFDNFLCSKWRKFSVSMNMKTFLCKNWTDTYLYIHIDWCLYFMININILINSCTLTQIWTILSNIYQTYQTFHIDWHTIISFLS